MKKEDMTYEGAFARLEKILEEMGKPGSSLEQSLKMYEEADQLVAFCNKQLSHAEQRVEVLIKNRNKELLVNEQGVPETEALS